MNYVWWRGKKKMPENGGAAIDQPKGASLYHNEVQRGQLRRGKLARSLDTMRRLR
jgi:hypothetical protein